MAAKWAASYNMSRNIFALERGLTKAGHAPLTEGERARLVENASEAFRQGAKDITERNGADPDPSTWDIASPLSPDALADLERQIAELMEKAQSDLEKVKKLLDEERSWQDEAKARINELYDAARGQIVEYRDPLVLDLDGDGIETVGTAAGVLFDHNASGVRQGTGWVKADDALVVLDRDGNGTIDSGRELFGNQTVLADGSFAAHGIHALAELDSNGNGAVDAGDARYGEVKLWRDLNQNGISEAGELQTLAQAGIAAIGLTAVPKNTALEGGNLLAYAGTYTRVDGATGDVGTVGTGTAADDLLAGASGSLDFALNPFYREFTDTVPISEAAAALPDVKGMGSVRDLREAASQSPELLAAVSGVSNSSELRAALPDIMDYWASTYETGTWDPPNIYSLKERAAGQNIDLFYAAFGDKTKANTSMSDWGTLEWEFERKLHILDIFNGRYTVTLPGGGGGGAVLGGVAGGGNGARVDDGSRPFPMSLTDAYLDNIDNAYYAIENYIFKAVWWSTILPNYMVLLQFSIDSGGLSFDFSAIEAALTDLAGTDATSAALDAAMLLRDVGFATLGWNGAEVLRAIIARNPDMDVLAASGNRLRQSRHRHHCTHRPRHRRHPAHRRAALLRQASTRARAWPFVTRHAPRQADVARRAKSSSHSTTSMNLSHR
jgi:hypothetical protein